MMQKTPRIEAYNRHMLHARKVLAQGFTAKSHQKDGMDSCNRAFEDAMEMIGDALLAARDAGSMDGESKEWRDLYYARPQAHVWNEKKAAPFVKHFPDLVKLANEAAVLRAAIKDTPLTAKKPSARQQQIAADDAKRMKCQICDRHILAETGKIAHHGYQRPGQGWQTDSCRGARELPYEADRAVLGVEVKFAKERLASVEAYRAQTDAEEIDIEFRREEYAGFNKPKKVISFLLSRANFATTKEANGAIFSRYSLYSFDDLKESELRSQDLNIKMVRNYVTWQEGRYAEWKQTHQWTGEKWEKVS